MVHDHTRVMYKYALHTISFNTGILSLIEIVITESISIITTKIVVIVSLGIKGFWNFTQYDIATNFNGIAVENVHLGDSLMTLCYQINNIDNLDEV